MTPLQIDFGKPERVVGIDLGTTNSLVAFMDAAGHPTVVPGEDGDKLVPSVVSLTRQGEIVVGNPARKALIDEPDRTVYSIKRLMGRGIGDVQEELKLFPFRIAEGSESVIRVQLGERRSRRRRFPRSSCASSRRTPKPFWTSRSRRP